MSELPYMPVFIADYMADTDHLSCEEHGAYLLLLMAMWRRGGSVPDDDRDLARMTRLSLRRWRAVKARLARLLIFEDGEISQKRVQKELEISRLKSKIASENAKKRWGASSSENSELADAAAMRRQCSPSPSLDNISSSKKYTGADAPGLFDDGSDQHDLQTEAEPDRKPKKKKADPIRDELRRVLDDERADAVIQHRKALKHPLTPRAAKLLADKFAATPDPNKSADTMIERGWRGFEPEWLERMNGGAGPPGAPAKTEDWRLEARALENEQRKGSDREIH